MIRSFLVTFSVVWAVVFASAQTNQGPFVPKGIDLSVNPHLAPMGTAGVCRNFMFDNGLMVKRPGFEFLTRSTDRDFTGIWVYIDDNGDKRLIACAQNTSNNYQSLYVSDIYSYNVGVTSLQDYIYLGETGTGAVYNGIFIFANGKNRPYRYNGTDFQPLVEVPPGSFDFAPEKPNTNTAQVLKGKYWYGWQAAFPDSVDGNTLFHTHEDSLNLDGPSWRIVADSDWVRIFSAPFTGPTRSAESPDSTIIRLCRTRAGKTEFDSMFRIETFRYDTSDFDFTFIDSIPDESLGVGDSYSFAGFIDTVTYDSLVVSGDSLYKIGQPQLLSKDSCISVGSRMISTDDTLLGKVTHRRYRFHWYDSSTSMISEPGPYLRVPADTFGTGVPRDSIITLVTPMFDTTKVRWGVLARAEEILDSIEYNEPTHKDIVDVNLGSGPICPHGYHPMTIRGIPKCVKPGVLHPNKIYTIVNPYYPVCTVKVSDLNGFCDTISDTTASGELMLREPILFNRTIGQLDNVIVMGDRVLMSQESNLYFNGFTDRGSEIGYWPAGNARTFGNNDGQEITGLHAGNNIVDVFKNRTWYKANETGANSYGVIEIKNNIGCISHHSIVDLPLGGLAFESENGFYVEAPAWQSQYKSTGENVNLFSPQIWQHLNAMTVKQKNECLGWITEDEKHLIFSFPSLDTSLVYNGQWSQWTFAPRMVVKYNISSDRYFGMLPDTGLLFILNDSDSLFRYGQVTTDTTDTILAEWKSVELYQTGEYGTIDEFKVWRYSNSTNGFNFNVYDILDTGIVATRRDTLSVRVKRKDISCPEFQACKIEITSGADSLAIDRIDLKYRPTGPWPIK